MLRSIAQSIVTQLSDSFPADQSYTPDQFSKSPMPTDVAHFLRKTLSRRLDFELERLKSDWFDFSSDPVVSRIEELRSSLEMTARVPSAEWDSTLSSAVRVVLSYLVRPTHTLVGFVFGQDQPEMSRETILRRMDYFQSYQYLSEIIDGHMTRKKIETLDRNSYLDLLTQADRMMVSDLRIRDWVNHLEPLYVLLSVQPDFQDGIPAALLRVHVADKGRTDMQRKLLAAENLHGKRYISRTDLRSILANDDPGIQAVASTVKSHYRVEPSSRLEKATAKDRSIPRWKQFQKQSAAGLPSMAPASDGSLAMALPRNETVHPSISQRDDRPATSALSLVKKGERLAPKPSGVSTGFSTGIPPQPSIAQFSGEITKEIVALEKHVLGPTSPERSVWFLRTLFNNDISHYRRVLLKIRSASEWNEASRIIAYEVFLPFEINIYGEPAVAFTDAVEARFRNR